MGPGGPGICTVVPMVVLVGRSFLAGPWKGEGRSGGKLYFPSQEEAVGFLW